MLFICVDNLLLEELSIWEGHFSSSRITVDKEPTFGMLFFFEGAWLSFLIGSELSDNTSCEMSAELCWGGEDTTD